MRDDVAFRSQLFGEQVAQRRDEYAKWQMSAMDRLADRSYQVGRDARSDLIEDQRMRMAMEQHSLDMNKGATDLAMDELRRKAASEELLWTQQLHTTDMLGLEKDAASLRVRMLRMQADRAERESNGDTDIHDLMRSSPEQMDYMIGHLGIMPRVNGGRVTFDAVDDNQRDPYRKRADERLEIQRRRSMSGQSYGSSMLRDAFRSLDNERRELEKSIDKKVEQGLDVSADRERLADITQRLEKMRVQGGAPETDESAGADVIRALEAINALFEKGQ